MGESTLTTTRHLENWQSIAKRLFTTISCAVCGMHHPDSLTYHKALGIAKGMEAAKQNTAFGTPEHTIKTLNGRPPKYSDSQRCYHCSHTNHRVADCKFQNTRKGTSQHDALILLHDGTYHTCVPLKTPRDAAKEKARSSVPTQKQKDSPRPG